MTDRHYYVTVEVTVQLCGSMEKKTPENLNKIRGKICDRIYNGNRKLDYSCYIHGENIMSVIDEKGNEI